MSHDQGRPSLFAGMEDGATPGSDTQRVRILSTLESTRRTQRPARKGPPPAKAPASTQSRAWAVTLGLGVVTLLVSFVLIVEGQRPRNKLLQPVAPQAKTPEQIAPAVTAALPAASAETEATASTAENLEVLPPTSASSSSIPSRDPMAALALTDSSAPASGPTPAMAKPSQAAPGKSNKATKSTKSNRGDHEVALIEAVMNRGASRPSGR